MSEQHISTGSTRAIYRVFISYSYDSIEHARRVLELAERLRDDGVDAQLDEYVAGTPSRGWPRWTLDQVDSAQFVLVVCTKTYHRRFLPTGTGEHPLTAPMVPLLLKGRKRTARGEITFSKTANFEMIVTRVITFLG